MPYKTGTISATGSANAVALVLSQSAPDTGVVVGVSGTFVGGTLVVEKQLRTEGPWYPVGVVEDATMAIDGGDAITLANSTVNSWTGNVAGATNVRAYLSAYTSGAVVVEIISGKFFDSPPVTTGKLQTTPAAGTVAEASIATAAVTVAKLGAGAATLPKVTFTGIKVLAAAGRNGAGAITLTGAVIGDRVIVAFGAPTAGGALAAPAAGTWESAITVTDQIQQASASNLTANTYVFTLVPATA